MPDGYSNLDPLHLLSYDLKDHSFVPTLILISQHEA